MMKTGKGNARDTAEPLVVAIDGTSASGKSTTARLVARALGFVYVDTGAMYRTLAWYCLSHGVDVHDAKRVGAVLGKWKASFDCEAGRVRMLVAGHYPEREIRTAETSAAVPHVAAVPKVREWMKRAQRDCVRFGSLVMEGRDIGSNVFPETPFKYYLDASIEERARRRAAEGVVENLAARDRRDSERAAAPLMIPLGAMVINNSGVSAEETCRRIVDDVQTRRMT